MQPYDNVLCLDEKNLQHTGSHRIKAYAEFHLPFTKLDQYYISLSAVEMKNGFPHRVHARG